MPNYPVPTNTRLAYDKDGSIGYFASSGGTVTQQSAGTMVALNDEAPPAADTGWSQSASGAGYRGILFPSPRDLTGYFLSFDSTLRTTQWTFGAVSVSTNTTTGFDGTWTNAAASYSGVISGAYRTGIVTFASQQNGVKGIRFYASPGGGSVTLYMTTLHLYGKPSTTTDRLEFWNPTTDVSLSALPGHLDWGDSPRGTTQYREIRVKNLSSSLTASSITVGAEALTDTSPSVVSQYAFKYGSDGSYGSTITIPTLAPGQISDIIEVRLTLDPAATLSLWTQRVSATAASWAA